MRLAFTNRGILKKLSIITICYNEPELEETCRSVVNQSWQDFEWIVVDGGSNKETQEIWEKYKSRIDKFISEPDTGRYNAMNKGIKLAQGEYLNFLNAGDSYFYNDALKDIFEGKNYSEGVLYGNESFVKKFELFDVLNVMPEKVDKQFFYMATIRHQAAFIRKELFDSFGLYDEENQVVSDYAKWLEFLEKGVEFRNLPYIVTKFNLDGISVKRKTKKIALSERERIINKFYSKEEIADLKDKCKKYTKTSYSLLENIFSIKDTNDGTRRVVTILGLHLKIRKGKKK